jgi:mxaJ protein
VKSAAAVALFLVAGVPAGIAAGAPSTTMPLRVCSDPNNMPFSNSAREGFENRLAEIVARELGTTVQYTWWAHRRGFVRNTLDARLCDVVMGLPTAVERVLVTRPYYRSTYVFVSRRGTPKLASMDDPALRRLRVGVQMIGNDYTSSPPAHALAARGIVANVSGYSVLGDYTEPAPASRIVRAVGEGEVDVAVVWGPLAGFFAPRQRTHLVLHPVSAPPDLAFLPFAFDIGMAVRRGETALKQRLDAVIVRRRGEIDALLARYGVPRA